MRFSNPVFIESNPLFILKVVKSIFKFWFDLTENFMNESSKKCSRKFSEDFFLKKKKVSWSFEPQN